MDYSCVRESGMVEDGICSQIIFGTHEMKNIPRITIGRHKMSTVRGSSLPLSWVLDIKCYG